MITHVLFIDRRVDPSGWREPEGAADEQILRLHEAALCPSMMTAEDPIEAP